MKRSRLDCRAVDRLLELEDVATRPDRAALHRHLAGCERCRARAPELEWLYGRLDGERASARPAGALRAAAALIVVLVVTVLVLRGARETQPGTAPQRVEPGLVVEPPRLLPAHHSHFEAGSVRLLPDQEQRSSAVNTTTSPDSETGSPPAPMEWTR